ncbi:MAG TPA: hypothetical protein ENF53_02560 [Thermoprotei archaeon]|nr:hypothetical protein [Thermoprotei archaeon]
MSKEQEIVYIEELKEEIGILSSLKRVVLSGILPFEYMEDISISPDPVGPFFCVFLLSLVNFFCIYAFLGRTTVAYVKVSPVAPVLNMSGKNILVYPNVESIPSNFIPLRITEGVLFRIYSNMVFLSLGLWISTLIGVYITTRLLGGYTKSIPVLSGYAISARIYEYLTRAILLYYLLAPFKIKILVPSRDNINTIISYIMVGFVKISERLPLLKGHFVFFIIWNIIVMIAVLNAGTRLSIKKSIIGGIMACIIAGGIHLIFSRLLDMF